MANRIRFETPPAGSSQPVLGGPATPARSSQTPPRARILWEIRPLGTNTAMAEPNPAPAATGVDPKKKNARLILVVLLSLVLVFLLFMVSKRSAPNQSSAQKALNEYRLYLDQRIPPLPDQLKLNRYQTGEQHLREFERAQQAKDYKRARTELDELLLLDRDTLSPVYRFSVTQLQQLPRP